MEKIKKFLQKLTFDERAKIEQIITQLLSNDLEALDLRKLKGHIDIYRVRIGKNRIIFKYAGEEILILEISRRNESTYKKT